MSRAVSFDFLSTAYGQETSETVIGLFVFSHDDLAEPFYISTDPTERISSNPLLYATTSRGNQYLFLPIRFTMPDDKTGSPPIVQLEMDNVNAEMIDILRSINSPLTVSLELVLASDPDTVEISFPSFQMADISVTEGQIVASLNVDALFNEPYPAYQMTPGTFPGLFG